jgi:hypothetical protein
MFSLTSNNTKCGKIITGMLKRERRLGKRRHICEYNTKVDTKEQGMDIGYICRFKGKTTKAWICKGGEFLDPTCVWLPGNTVFHGVTFLVIII